MVKNKSKNDNSKNNKNTNKSTSNKKFEKKYKSTNKRKTWKKIDTTEENKTTVKKLQQKIEENDIKDINIDDYITYDVEKKDIPEGFLGRKTKSTLSSKNNRGFSKLMKRKLLKIQSDKEKELNKKANTENQENTNLNGLKLKKSGNKNELNLIEDIWGNNTENNTKSNNVIRLKDINNKQPKEEKKIISLPKLSLPHPGLSYNPNIQDSKNLIYTVANLNKDLYESKKFTTKWKEDVAKSNEELFKRMREQKEKEKEKRKLKKNKEDSDSETDEDYESSSEEVDSENSEENNEESKKAQNKKFILKRSTLINREHSKNLNRLKNMKDKIVKENKKEIYSLISAKKFGKIQEKNMNEQDKIDSEKRKLSKKYKNLKIQGAVVE